jgi:hypothetical protein
MTTIVPVGNSMATEILSDTATTDFNGIPTRKPTYKTDKTFAEQPQLWAVTTVYKVRIQIYATSHQ